MIFVPFDYPLQDAAKPKHGGVDGVTMLAYSALLTLAPDLDGAVATALARLGPEARVAVMPEGPLTVATVRSTV